MNDETPDSVVYVLDSVQVVRESLCLLLASADQHAIGFASLPDFLTTALQPVPSCILMDLMIPGINGLDALVKMVQTGLPVIVLTGIDTSRISVAALRRGAFDVLHKPVDDTVLLASIEGALEENRRVLERIIARELAVTRAARLTQREREVFDLVTTGLLNKQIAGELGISIKTVKIHRGRVMRKAEANSVADLVRMADLLRS